jgi:Tfp pilus assembly protein PilF
MAFAFLASGFMFPPMRTRILALIIVGLAWQTSVSAQARQPNIPSAGSDRISRGGIRGRVIMPDGSFVNEAVRITLQNMRDTIAIVYTENQGQFEFQSLPPAMYYLEIEADGQKFEVVTESVQVFRGVPSVVTITLKPRRSSNRKAPAEHTVSVAELKQNIPSKAKKEFEKASEAGNAGKTDEAIAHLRKAISLFPDFVRARNDLGTYLLSQGKLDQAAEELGKAVSLDDKSFYPALNLGIVFVHQQRFAEASEVLTKGLSLEPNSSAAHFYSGLAFIGLGKLTAAEGSLKTAYSLGGPKYAVALFHLGQLYMNRGERDSALKSFENYLVVVPDARNADQVRKLIAMLRP